MSKYEKLYKKYLESLTEQDFDRLEDKGEFLKDIDVTDNEFLEMEKQGETPIDVFYCADGSFRIGEEFEELEETETADNQNKHKNTGEVFIFMTVLTLIAIFVFLQNT